MQLNVTEWLDETARRFPDKIAFADKDQELTFKEIRRKALDLAAILVEKGYFKKAVAVYMEKSVDVLVSFFAAAYSGNFYSPIDISMPVERIHKILEILQPEVIITRQGLKDQISQFQKNADVIFIEVTKEVTKEVTIEVMMEDPVLPDPAADSNCKKENRDAIVLRQRERVCDTDLLYVLFTSGSTGVPKGVTIHHRAVIDYIDCIQSIFDFNEQDVLGNQAPFYFDNSVLDIYTALKTGATMYIIPPELFSWPVRLLQYLEEKNISAIFWVPSAMIVVAKLGALKKIDLNRTLRKILFCGEVMPNKTLNIWRRYIPDAVYANLYGPTEITDCCTYYLADRPFSDEEPLPIGVPMKNTDILVLNDKDELVSFDETGELCVRGTSLSMGYYGNPQKTKEVFVQNPLNSQYPELIYRTGDLVRYNAQGQLMYVSRKDYQIKHMGHRIELGEIETAVSSIDNTGMNCCLYDEKRSRIVLFMEGDMELSVIQKQLARLIPDYMIPNRLIRVEHMPVNMNGKIDRVKLKEQLYKEQL